MLLKHLLRLHYLRNQKYLKYLMLQRHLMHLQHQHYLLNQKYHLYLK
jgi:hypothetical protein